jgi:hypothetical protein
MGMSCQPNAQSPTWRVRVFFFVQNLTHYLSSYATNGITLEITGSHGPHHNSKVETQSGDTKPTWRILHILLKTTIVRYEISVALKKKKLMTVMYILPYVFYFCKDSVMMTLLKLYYKLEHIQLMFLWRPPIMTQINTELRPYKTVYNRRKHKLQEC